MHFDLNQWELQIKMISTELMSLIPMYFDPEKFASLYEIHADRFDKNLE